MIVLDGDWIYQAADRRPGVPLEPPGRPAGQPAGRRGQSADGGSRDRPGPGVQCLRSPAAGGPAHCRPASQFRANLIARATFTNLLAMWLNASEIV